MTIYTHLSLNETIQRLSDLPREVSQSVKQISDLSLLLDQLKDENASIQEELRLIESEIELLQKEGNALIQQNETDINSLNEENNSSQTTLTKLSLELKSISEQKQLWEASQTAAKITHEDKSKLEAHYRTIEDFQKSIAQLEKNLDEKRTQLIILKRTDSIQNSLSNEFGSLNFDSYYSHDLFEENTDQSNLENAINRLHAEKSTLERKLLEVEKMAASLESKLGALQEMTDHQHRTLANKEAGLIKEINQTNATIEHIEKAILTKQQERTIQEHSTLSALNDRNHLKKLRATRLSQLQQTYIPFYENQIEVLTKEKEALTKELHKLKSDVFLTQFINTPIELFNQLLQNVQKDIFDFDATYPANQTPLQRSIIHKFHFGLQKITASDNASPQKKFIDLVVHLHILIEALKEKDEQLLSPLLRNTLKTLPLNLFDFAYNLKPNEIYIEDTLTDLELKDFLEARQCLQEKLTSLERNPALKEVVNHGRKLIDGIEKERNFCTQPDRTFNYKYHTLILQHSTRLLSTPNDNQLRETYRNLSQQNQHMPYQNNIVALGIMLFLESVVVATAFLTALMSLRPSSTMNRSTQIATSLIALGGSQILASTLGIFKRTSNNLNNLRTMDIIARQATDHHQALGRIANASQEENREKSPRP